MRKLRRSYNCKDQIVKYYHCHQSKNKRRPYRKTYFIRPSQEMDSNQDKKCRLCNYFFQLKTVEVFGHNNSGRDLQVGHVTISVHTQHTSHIPGLEDDILFLPIHS